MDEKTQSKIQEIEKIWKSNNFDPNGSYVGNEVDGFKPVQDQDDL